MISLADSLGLGKNEFLEYSIIQRMFTIKFNIYIYYTIFNNYN